MSFSFLKNSNGIWSPRSRAMLCSCCVREWWPVTAWDSSLLSGGLLNDLDLEVKGFWVGDGESCTPVPPWELSCGQPWPLGNSQPVGWAQISENITLEGRVWFSCISDCRSHEVHFRQFGKYIKKRMLSSAMQYQFLWIFPYSSTDQAQP